MFLSLRRRVSAAKRGKFENEPKNGRHYFVLLFQMKTYDNKKKSKQSWFNVWRSWAEAGNINPNLTKTRPMYLRFYVEVRNKHGEQCEPKSLKSMTASVDRYLLL